MRICVPIKVKNKSQALALIKRAKTALKGQPDGLLEIWLDTLPVRDFSQIFRVCKLPVIAVCRGREEKGNFEGSENERIEKLLHAVNVGAAFVDIGMQTAAPHIRRIKKLCVKKRSRLILSTHLWNATPPLAELERIFSKAKKMGADIVKIAASVLEWTDNVTLFEFTRRISSRKQKAIVIGMGERGRISRIGCPLLGSYLTYVALDKKSATAPGQLCLSKSPLSAFPM